MLPEREIALDHFGFDGVITCDVQHALHASTVFALRTQCEQRGFVIELGQRCLDENAHRSGAGESIALSVGLNVAG